MPHLSFMPVQADSKMARCLQIGVSRKFTQFPAGLSADLKVGKGVIQEAGIRS